MLRHLDREQRAGDDVDIRSAELVRVVLPVLADRSVPAPVRLAATATMLAAVPDEPRVVAPIVQAATDEARTAAAVRPLGPAPTTTAS